MADVVRWGKAFLLAALAVWLAPAYADLADPTRPPAGFSAQGSAPMAEAPLRVDGVFLMGARPYAVVDGVTVRVGDPLGDGRVAGIDEQGVWLKTPAGKRQLRLVPGIDKRAPGKIKTEKAK